MDDRAATPVIDPPAAPRLVPPARLVAADARQALEQLKTSSAVGEGKVCLVSVEAIRSRLGERWPARRDLVHQHALASLRRHMGPHGVCLRISETDFLIAQPDVNRLAGQVCCLNSLRDVLTYFLGEAQMSDLVVQQVTSIGEGEIAARPLDAAALETAAGADDVFAMPTPPPDVAPPASQDRWSPFVSRDGRRLRVSCQLEPVFALKTYARIGYRMTRRVLALPAETPLSASELAQLTGADMERIDFATLARGLNRLAQEGGGERQPSLILPVSFATLSSQRGRAMLVEFFRAARETVQRGLICEVCDIDGVPSGALLAATSLMRPFCLFIVGRLGAAPQTSLEGAVRNAGLHGLSIERPANLTGDDAFGAFARAVVGAAKPAARAVMIYGLAGPRQAAIASLYGATHASFAAVRSPG